MAASCWTDLDLKPDMVVLDVSMSVVSGLAVGRQLKANRPEIKLIYLPWTGTERGVIDKAWSELGHCLHARNRVAEPIRLGSHEGFNRG